MGQAELGPKWFCVVHSPVMPTQMANTATPATTASQLIAHRISETNGRISQISHVPNEGFGQIKPVARRLAELPLAKRQREENDKRRDPDERRRRGEWFAQAHRIIDQETAHANHCYASSVMVFFEISFA